MGEDVEKMQDVGFMQDVISYVFDEKNIVTYKWISKKLNIHVNKAKQLLYTFIKHLPDERLEQLEVTYLVGGVLPDDRGCRIQVVSKEDLPKVKEQFKVITSEHIYSVSCKACLSDLHDLFSVDGVKNSETPRHGAVCCNQSLERDAEELAAKRRNAQITVDDGKQWPADKPKQQNGTAGNDKKKSSSSISSMFAAANNKKKTEESAESKKDEGETKKEDEPSVDEAKKKAPAGKGAHKNTKAAPGSGRLAAMFSAQSSKPKPVKKEEKKEIIEKTEDKDDQTPKNPSMEKESSLQNESKENKNETQKKSVGVKRNKSEEKKSKQKQKRRKASEKHEENNKKRKRIVLMADSDSSDDDVFGSEEEETVDQGRCPNPTVEDDEQEDPPENKGVKEEGDPEQKAEPTTKGHARKRVVVNKTFMDEEGYIVSKKVVEFISCSEDEDEKENEKEEEKKKDPESKTVQKMKKDSSKKMSPPEKKKQATLMSFFKRN